MAVAKVWPAEGQKRGRLHSDDPAGAGKESGGPDSDREAFLPKGVHEYTDTRVLSGFNHELLIIFLALIVNQ